MLRSALLWAGFAVAVSGCQKGTFSSARGASSNQAESESLELAKVCSSVDARYLQNTVAPLFGLKSGDVPMVDSNKNLLVSDACRTYRQTANGRRCGFIETFLSELNSDSCGSDKLKVLVSLYINGCSQGLIANSVVKSLFPAGSSDPTQIYNYLIGRDITSDEREVLDELRTQIEGVEAQQIAVCATIASSYLGITIN